MTKMFAGWVVVTGPREVENGSTRPHQSPQNYIPHPITIAQENFIGPILQMVYPPLGRAIVCAAGSAWTKGHLTAPTSGTKREIGYDSYSD